MKKWPWSSNTESNHNSIDPNEADDNSSKASVHSTGSHIPIHSITSEPPQHPPDEEEPDDTELPELETQVPILHCSERVSVPPSDYVPWMGGKMYITNIQTNTNQDKEKGLVYITTLTKPESWQQSSPHSTSIWSV